MLTLASQRRFAVELGDTSISSSSHDRLAPLARLTPYFTDSMLPPNPPIAPNNVTTFANTEGVVV